MNHRNYTSHDNVKFDVTTDGKDGLLEIITLAYKVTGHRKAKGYVILNIDGVQTLIFLCATDGPCKEKLSKFPAPLDAEASTIVAAQWLEQQEMGIGPDHDGDNVEGFRVFVKNWGHIGEAHYATIVGIAPYWLTLGK